MKQLRGVNLGGWFVVEKWMTPSLFAGTAAADEYTLSQTAEGRRRITEHRKRYITKRDIAWLKRHGVDVVRIPVGYWQFLDSPPYVYGSEQVDACMKWCEEYDIKVIIDLHTVPGSQNGNDHSGRVGEIGFWRQAENQEKAICVLRTIAEKYAHSPVLWGIQVMNEPHVGRYLFQLRRWYRQAYRALDEMLPGHIKIIFSDGFRPRLMNGAMGEGRRAVMDMHHYHFATKYPWFSRVSMMLYALRLKRRKRLIRRLGRTQPVMIGEWSAVLGHELLAAESIDDVAYERTLLPWHIEAQREAFSDAVAVCYWSYRMEDSVGEHWQARALVERGILRYNTKNG